MNAESILNYLSMVSNQNIYLNLIMHVITFLSIPSIFLLKNKRMQKAVFNGLVFILTLSVTVNAFINGNPFHLATFAILSIIALRELIGRNQVVISASNNVTIFVAFIFLFIGVWYPEFVHTTPLAMLFISPMGIVPCPTLIVILSLFSLNSSGISKIQYIATIIIGAVYAVIGVFLFKVYLDAALGILVFYSIYILISNKVQEQKNTSLNISVWQSHLSVSH